MQRRNKVKDEGFERSLIKIGIVWLFVLVMNNMLLANSQPPFRFHAEQVPLQTCLQAIAKSMQLELILETPLLTPVSVHAEHGSAEAFLQALANSHQLHITIKKPVLYVTTKQQFWQKQHDLQKLEQLHKDHMALSLHMIPLQYASAALLAKQLQTSGFLSARGHLQWDARTNTLVIHDTAKELDLIKRIVQTFDRPVPQLMIEARLISIDHDAENALGLNVQSSHSKERSMLAQEALRVLRLTPNLEIKLALLEKEGHAEVLSSPKLFTLDQQTAVIETGEEVPYQEHNENGTTTVTFKKAVLGLKITPHVLPQKRIALTIQLTHDRPSARLVQGMPTITTRQLLTNVILRHEEMVVLGGIYEHNEETTITQWAGLHRIPLLGQLFKQRNQRHSKRELLILVRPTLMANTS